MAGINSRVFGSDIPNKVKAKLEIRQALSKNPNIRYDNNAELKRIQEKYNGVQDIDPYQVTDDIIKAEIGDFLQTASGIERSDANFLSTRTPFVRMWTCVELHDADFDEDDLAGINIYDEDFPELDYFEDDIEDPLKAFAKKANLTIDAASFAGGGATVAIPTNKDGFIFSFQRTDRNHNTTGTAPTISKPIGRWVLIKSSSATLGFDRKFYVLGNHNLTTFKTNPGDSRENMSEQDWAQIGVFPNEHEVTAQVPDPDNPGQTMRAFDDNRFLKPGAGITSVTSETMGSLGLIKKTTVNFEVHNFHDFDSIYNKVFLRPGAQVFVDWGWSSADLYEINDELIDGGVQKKLFVGDDCYMAQSQGDTEVVMGVVTDYIATIKDNGSVACSVTITSKNQALLTYNANTPMVATKISYILDHLIWFDGIMRLSKNTEDEDKSLRQKILKSMIPGKDKA